MEFSKNQKRIVEVLSDEEDGVKVNDIADEIGCSRQTVYNNYPELERAGIVEVEELGRSNILRMSSNTKGEVVKSAVEDTEVIENTSLDNASSTKQIEGESRELTRITAYRNQGTERGFDKKIKVGEEKVSVSEVLEKVLGKLEDETEKELEKRARDIYEKYLEKYIGDEQSNIREKLKVENNRNNIIKPLVKGSEMEITRLNTSINSDPVEIDGRPRPEYLFLKFQPGLFNFLGGDVEETKELLQDKIIEPVDNFKAVREDLDEVEEHLDVLRQEELNMLKEVQEEIEERREGKLMLTVTRSLGILPHMYREVEPDYAQQKAEE